ncbi:hypothetical protein D9M69_680510 [compost metagenome]
MASIATLSQWPSWLSSPATAPKAASELAMADRRATCAVFSTRAASPRPSSVEITTAFTPLISRIRVSMADSAASLILGVMFIAA